MKIKFYALTKELAEATFSKEKTRIVLTNLDINEFDEIIVLFYNISDNSFIYRCKEFKTQRVSINRVFKGNEKYEIWNEPEKETKEESLFRVGDTVYYLNYDCSIYHVGVIIEPEEGYSGGANMVKRQYDDTCNYVSSSELSFTPWSRETGGFSQVRPKPEPKVGDIGWFWNHSSDLCGLINYGILNYIDEKGFYSKEEHFFHFFSTENPFIK